MSVAVIVRGIRGVGAARLARIAVPIAMVLTVALAAPTPARAELPTTPVTARQESFSSLGRGLWDNDQPTFALDGLLRLRGEALHNFDLDHGVGPSGQGLWPTSPGSPTAQTQRHADMRLRLDGAAIARRGLVAVRGRVDVLDNVGLGAQPDGPPTAAGGQRAAANPLAVRRLWGEALLPFGVLAAGRMGSHWGLGLLTHGGDCHDCDSGDAADRIALVVPAAGLLWALAYEITATGPSALRPSGQRGLDLDPADDVRSVTFAAMRALGPTARTRRLAAGRVVVEGGLWGSHRRQRLDVPRWWLPGPDAGDVTLVDQAQVVERDFSATAGDLWIKIEGPRWRIEAEGAVLHGSYGQASLLPGLSLRSPVEALQWGAALQSRWGREHAGLSVGLDAGAASGDPAPGMGARQPLAGTLPRPGDFDGAQAAPPGDGRIDNMRLHPDFRIDRVLFREIVGRITDATWLRPHLRWAGAVLGDVQVVADVAVVGSMALEPNSTPSGKRALGLEIDPTLSLSLRGLLLEWQGGLLLPGAGLDNTIAGLAARPAWMTRIFLGFAF